MKNRAGWMWAGIGVLMMVLVAATQGGRPVSAETLHQSEPCDPWQTVIPFDFETNDGGFTAEEGVWVWGDLVPHTDGPPSAHSGSKLWATNLSGPIPDEPSDHRLSKTIDLPLMSAGELQWWDWWHEDGVDEGRVTINGELVYFVNENQLEWEQHAVDLTPWQGETIEIVWEYLARPTDEGGAGWYIDDVAVVSCNPANAPELGFSTMAAPDVAVSGRAMDVSVTAFNSGLVDAPNTRLRAPLPTGATLVEGSITGGASYNAAEKQIEWQGTLTSAEKHTISYKLRASGGNVIAHSAVLTQPTLSAPVTLSAETQLLQTTDAPICEGFEEGDLPSYMTAETSVNGAATGRVTVDQRFPYTGSYGVNLDTDCGNGTCGDGTFTQQALVMALDLAGQTQVELNFWAYNHDDEEHAQDGVFISDDGGLTYAQAMSFIGLPERYKNVTVDLGRAASDAGMQLTDGFLIKLQSYDNFAIQLDGMSFDDVCVQRLNAPEISTDPGVLALVQPGDTTRTSQFMLENNGFAPLRYVINEASVSTQDAPQSYPAPTIDMPFEAESQLEVADSAETMAYAQTYDTLVDYTSGIPTTIITGIKSQEFEPSERAFNAQAADDFEVPKEDGAWTIRRVEAIGFYEGGNGPADFANVFIYRDDGGLPGVELYSTDGVAVAASDDGTLVIDLDMPAVLPSGHYWISVQPDMDFATEGIWNWTMRTEAAGDEFAWRNPGGGWNNPCTDWGSRSSCGYNLPNLAFRLAGTKADCVPHNVSWLRVSPMSGTLEGDSVSAVDVTINTNDLADGSYRADLCILNNDPNSGIYTLPVELTVGKVFGYLPMVVR